MKDYVDYMNSISVSADLHEKILERAASMDNIIVLADRREQNIGQTALNPKPPAKPRSFRRYAGPAAIAAACLIVFGYAFFAIPRFFGGQGDDAAIEPGPSVISEPEENLKTDGSNPDEDPRQENYVLTLEQAQTDADFGAYVSKSVPPRFSFVSSLKSAGQVENSLTVLWKETTGASDGSISWIIFKSAADEQNRIVSANEREKYDMAYYSSPWDECVPDELLGVLRIPFSCRRS